MNSRDDQKTPGAADARQARLEKQMRENLMKRKALKRARSATQGSADMDGEANQPERGDNLPGSTQSEP